MRNEVTGLAASCPRVHDRGLALGVLFSLISASAALGQPFDALIFSKTAGFRHDSIPQGITMFQQLASANGFTATFTEDANTFTAGGLAPYEVVVFLNTTGDVLNGTQEAAFMSYIQGGKGYVGIHSASDTEHGWAWYGGLVGAYFASHPAGTANFTIEVADRVHPSTSVLPKYWARHDEIYNFSSNPRGQVHVLGTADEGTYSGGTMGFDHPFMWCHEYDGGRAWYTASGHTQSTYSEANFRSHVLGGLKWAAGVVGGDAEASVPTNYQKVVLDTNISEPMAIAPAPDGRIFFIQRGGAVKIYRPAQGNTVTAGTLSVYTGQEDGLLGIALDPSFASNQRVYLLYSTTAASQQRLSRFTMSGDTLNMGSEIIMLTIPTQRTQCCHSAGSLAFGSNGHLYISTGDNTNPFESSGYTPIDERAGRSDWDAQKSSGNRNDLRGKILRIVPTAAGGYTIPSGNLFPSDGSNGRAEVYAMGCRNPFKMTVDPENNWVYWGDVGPDAGSDSGTRGPMGYDEVNQARNAGNFGWPYCIANNLAYRDFNFATGQSGSLFNCAAPTNNSPNNTGSQSLPASTGAFIWYPYSNSSTFPEMNGGSVNRTMMAGPVYHFNPSAPSGKFPQYYDDTLFLHEWSRNYLKEVKLDDSGNILKINPFLQNMTFTQPIDLEFGVDGKMYMLEWNPARLSRIEYVQGSLAPFAMASGTPDSGLAPLTVNFSSAGSFDPDGTIIAYEWDFTSNGSTDSTLANPSFQYTSNGSFTAKLTVRDNDSNTAIANVPIVVGNTRPVVTISSPVEGGFFDWNSTVAFTVSVSDAQDGSTGGGQIPCSSVNIQPYLGHDTHSHGMTPLTGCTGIIPTAGDGGHPPEDDLYYIFEAKYTDLGAPGSIPLTGIKQYKLQPKRKQAEHFTTQNGIQFENCADVGGGENAGFIDHGDYVSFNPMNFSGITSVTYRVASAGLGGNIELRLGSPTGTLVHTAVVPVTGGWQTWVDVTVGLTPPSGTHHVYMVFKRNPGEGGLFNVNYFQFNGNGISGGSAVTYDLGLPDVASGMTHIQVGDGDTIAATIGGKVARRNVNTAEDYYFYFAVDDTYAVNGSRPVNFISIDYYDTGSGSLTLQYDATDGNFYKSGGSVTLTNSNTWKTHQYSVTDAYFGNRQNNSSDFRIFLGTGVTRHLDIVSVASSSTLSQAPFLGSPIQVPSTIQAEHYDVGGQGVAYSDGTPGNSGGQFRSDNVDIESTSDTGGGYNVGFIDAGEMLEYTINVATAGTYTINLRVASPGTSGSYHIELNGVNLTGTKTVPNTGGFQTWTTTSAGSYAFTTGQKVLRVYMEGSQWNLNYIEVQGTQAPFGGTPRAIPGLIQAEDYDTGGEDTAYNDIDVGNSGGAYRTDNVDIEATTDTGGGYNVGFINTGEWLEYTVNVASAGSYNINVRVASPNTGGSYHIEMNGVNVTGTKTVPNTGGWQTWTTVTSSNVSLNAGQQIMRLFIDSGGWNFNFVDVQTAGGGTPYFPNSSFENGFSAAGGGFIGSVGTGWTPYIYNGVASNFTFADETGAGNFDTGAHSQKITAAAGKEGGVYNRFAVTSGQNYTVTVRVKSASPTGWCFMGVDPTGGTNSLAGTVQWPMDNSRSTSWQTLTWSGQAAGSFITLFLDTYDGAAYWDTATPASPGGPVTVNNSAFPSNADGWNVVVWKSGPYNNGTMAWQSANGNPTGNMRSTGDGGSNNTDSCTREGGEINKAVSTAGYNTLVQVVYDVRMETNQTGTSCIGTCPVLEGNCADKLAVYYSTAGTAGPWTLLEAVNASSITQNVWSTRTLNVPAGGNNQANFAVRFRWQFNQATDGGRLDNVKVIATP